MNCVEVDVTKSPASGDIRTNIPAWVQRDFGTLFDWRQTPNVNEAMTCYDACGGWCVSDDEKTSLLETKRCSATREACTTDADCACDTPITEDNCFEFAQI